MILVKLPLDNGHYISVYYDERRSTHNFMRTMSKKTAYITQAALIAALYTVLTMIAAGFDLASGAIQVRFSEALTRHTGPLFGSTYDHAFLHSRRDPGSDTRLSSQQYSDRMRAARCYIRHSRDTARSTGDLRAS